MNNRYIQNLATVAIATIVAATSIAPAHAVAKGKSKAKIKTVAKTKAKAKRKSPAHYETSAIENTDNDYNPYSYAQYESPATTSASRNSYATRDSDKSVTVELESSISKTEFTSENESTEYTATKLKPIISFDTETTKFVGFVPFTWLKGESKSTGSTNQDDDASIRLVGRPDLSGHFKIWDQATWGLGVKLPMFSISEGDADFFRSTQIYTQGKLQLPIAGSVDGFADVKIEKNLDNKRESDSGGSLKLVSPFVFRGEGGVTTPIASNVDVGTSLKGIYNLNRGKTVWSFKTFESESKWGAVKYSSLNVFGDVELTSNAKIRTRVSKALTTTSESESMAILHNVDEIDQMADLALTIHLIGSF